MISLGLTKGGQRQGAAESAGVGWGRIEKVELYTELEMEQFLEVGRRKCSDERFPTFTTSRPRGDPGRKLAGLHQCTAEELARWTR